VGKFTSDFDWADIILGIILLVPMALLRGFVVFTLWGWFLIPLGLPAIGIAHAMGISGMVLVS
jgi:hypothetical protein